MKCSECGQQGVTLPDKDKDSLVRAKATGKPWLVFCSRRCGIKYASERTSQRFGEKYEMRADGTWR